MAPTALHVVSAPPPRAAEPPVRPDIDINSSATRHLSAGAYLDDEFCLEALREVYYQPRRVVAPSHGFDLVTVLGHCLRARRAMVARDLLLVTVLAVAYWHSLTTMAAILVTLLAVHTAAAAVRVIRDAVRYLRGPGRAGLRRREAGEQPPQFRRVLFGNLVAQLVARIIGVALAYALLAGGAGLLTILLRQTGFGADRRLTVGAPVLAACLVAVFLVPVAARVRNQLCLLRLLPAETPGRPVRNHRLAAIDEQADGNTVIYSGHSPFVGSGIVLRRWDFAQRLVRAVPKSFDRTLTEADREFPTPPFTAWEISAYVREEIARLSTDPVPERRLPDLTVYDRVFVAGTEISRVRRHTGPDDLAEIIRNPTAPERHYLAFQVVSWRGELVTTVYVHFAVQGRSLYVELYVTGLLPCEPRFRVVDEVGGTGAGAALRDAGRAVVATPALVASAPGNLLRACSDALRLSTATDLETSRLRRGYDYGAAIGIRELGASPVTRDHMQAQDIMKYGRLIERRVLASILDFLEAHDVDVTEYRQQSLTILNAGAVATEGGTVNVSGDAVGAAFGGVAGDGS